MVIGGMHVNIPIRIETPWYASMFRALPLAEVPLDILASSIKEVPYESIHHVIAFCIYTAVVLLLLDAVRNMVLHAVGPIQVCCMLHSIKASLIC